MNKILLFAVLAILGCGQNTEFELKNVTTNLIQSFDKTNSTLDYLIESDTILKESKLGIVFNFEVNVIGNSGSHEPGNKGTKDSIIQFEITLHQTNQISDITNKLINIDKPKTYIYCSEYANIREFIWAYNNLHIDNKKTIINSRVFKTGFELVSKQYLFWFKEEISQKISKDDTIQTKIVLSNKSVFIDKFILR